LTNIRQVTNWSAPIALAATYERLLATIGTDAFGAEVRSSVFSMTAGARRIYLFEAADRETSSLHYFFCESKLVNLFPAYKRWYMRQDPIGEAFSATPESNDIALQKVRPADIASRSFRRRFFEDAGIIERVSVVQRGVDAWRGISIARHTSHGYCSDDEIRSLVGLACLALPMLPLNRTQKPRPRLTVTQLEARFADRYATLTTRERQVCARAAMGMSVEATAQELGIAKTSVLTYRQRAYQRLSVKSPFELSGLVAQ
jgi:DNA-binding CsgD family transcriptional regulator